jgi:hypothetical protein
VQGSLFSTTGAQCAWVVKVLVRRRVKN